MVQVGGQGALRKRGGSEHGVTWTNGSNVFRKDSSQDPVKGNEGREGGQGAVQMLERAPFNEKRNPEGPHCGGRPRVWSLVS